jgi:hypothetical protein
MAIWKKTQATMAVQQQNRTRLPPRLGFLASRKYPILYLNMPKSGCTSIKNILYFIDNDHFFSDPLAIHSSAVALLKDTQDAEVIYRLLDSHFTFTFVRHPLKRAYSLFNEKVHATGQYAFPFLRKFMINHYGARFSERISCEDHRNNFLLFLNFVDDSLNGRIPIAGNAHWAAQESRVRRAASVRTIDFIGRVESFDLDLDFVLRKAGYTGRTAFPAMNEGPPPPYRYDEMLTDEIAAKGQAVYGRDFKAFGYSC